MEEKNNLSLGDFLNQDEIKDMIKHNLEQHFKKIYLQKDRIKSLLEEMYKPVIKEQVEKCTEEVIKARYIKHLSDEKFAETVLDHEVDRRVKEEISYYLRVFVQDHLKTAVKDYINDNIGKILENQDFKESIEKLFKDEKFLKQMLLNR